MYEDKEPAKDKECAHAKGQSCGLQTQTHRGGLLPRAPTNAPSQQRSKQLFLIAPP